MKGRKQPDYAQGSISGDIAVDNENTKIAPKIATVFAAGAAVMLLTNGLHRKFGFTETQFYSIGFILDVISVYIVLRVNPWRPKVESPARLLSSLFFMFGAFAVCLFFGSYWSDWASSFDPKGEILGPMREIVPVSISSSSLVFDAIRRVIITPFVEEIVIRLGILGVLSRIMPKGLALIISSVAFALGHIYVYEWVQIIPLLVFGLMMGVTYLRAGLGFSILLHSMVNGWTFVKENLYQFDSFLIALMIVLFSGLIVFSVQLVRHRKLVFGS